MDSIVKAHRHTGNPIFFLLRLQAAVISALAALCEEYYQAEPGQADLQMQGKLNIIPELR